jgi:hypothetical protein
MCQPSGDRLAPEMGCTGYMTHPPCFCSILAVLDSTAPSQSRMMEVRTIMGNHLVHFAKRVRDQLANVAQHLFRRLTQPALINPITGTLADLPRSRAQLLAENAFLHQQLAVLHRQTKPPASLGAIVFPYYCSPPGSRTGSRSCKSFNRKPCCAGTDRVFGCSGS